MVSDTDVTADLAARTLAMVVRESGGTALDALTRLRAQSALPFAGQYSSSDFPLSNCVNSGIPRIALLTDQGIQSWLQQGRRGPHVLRPVRVHTSPPRPYTGTADAVYRNLRFVEESSPAYVLVHVGDDVCRMDYRALLETHVASGLSATIGCVEVPAAIARGFRVIRVGSHGRVIHCADRPVGAQPLPHDPATVLVSIGVYAFDRDSLVDCLSVDAEDRWSGHDFGRDVLPLLIRAGGVAAHVFQDPQPGQSVYWRELGTLDRYWRANLELLAEQPVIDFADRGWPLWTRAPQGPPPRVFGSGKVLRSIVSAGCVIGGCVEGSVLSPECVVRPGATVQDSVLLPGVQVGTGSRISKAVIDSGCVVPDGITIGDDPAQDAASFDLSAEGVALVTADGLARAARTGRRDSLLV